MNQSDFLAAIAADPEIKSIEAPRHIEGDYFDVKVFRLVPGQNAVKPQVIQYVVFDRNTPEEAAYFNGGDPLADKSENFRDRARAYVQLMAQQIKEASLPEVVAFEELEYNPEGPWIKAVVYRKRPDPNEPSVLTASGETYLLVESDTPPGMAHYLMH
ncbi:MAG: hypothetical protein AAFY15_01975 [Cyanobacteria bacterium J06648_11]